MHLRSFSTVTGTVGLHALLLSPKAVVFSSWLTFLVCQGLWCVPLWKHPEVSACFGTVALAGFVIRLCSDCNLLLEGTNHPTGVPGHYQP